MSKRDPFTIAAAKITDRVFAAKAEQPDHRPTPAGLLTPRPGFVLISVDRLCLYPACENTKRTRGLCHCHYQNARAYIRAGKITEADLEARGLMAAKGDRQR